MIDTAKPLSTDTGLREKLLDRAMEYGRITGMKISGVGRKARNDPNYFRRLRDDPASSFTARTFDEAMRWFDENWPQSEAAQ